MKQQILKAFIGDYLGDSKIFMVHFICEQIIFIINYNSKSSSINIYHVFAGKLDHLHCLQTL